MAIKRLFFLAFLVLLSASNACTNEDEFPSDAIVIWVNSSLKKECNPNLVQSNCLMISKAETLVDALWEIPVREIQGFTYSDGYYYRLLVKEIIIPETDSDQIQEKSYRLLKILSTEKDEAYGLGGRWYLEFADGLSDSAPGKTYIFTPSERVLSGSHKCNPISYKAWVVTKDKISYRLLSVTEEDCTSLHYVIDPRVEDKIHENFLQIAKYRLDSSYRLILMNEKGKTLIILHYMWYNPKPAPW